MNELKAKEKNKVTKNKEIILCMKDLAVAYQKNVAIFDINLDINRHDFFGICGPNGSGKSTLLKTIVGALKPIQGNLRLFGKNMLNTNIRDIQSKISYLPQIDTIDRNFPALVKDVVGMGLYAQKGFFRSLNNNDHQRIRNALKMIGIEKLIERPIGHLSGGQQQKVKIARALVNNPEILLIDEPFSALDFKIAKDIAQILEKIHSETNITIVMVSHNIALIREYCNRAACLDHRLIWEGNPKSNAFDEAIQSVFHY